MQPNPLTSPQPEAEIASQDPATSLSKRAARRIIQRAFVLMGRDKILRHQIRESELSTVWAIEDWQLEWTVFFHRGRFEVERRLAKHPDVSLAWSTARQFFDQVDRFDPAAVQMLPANAPHRFFDTLVRGFFANLRHVLMNPVDDAGESLL